MVVCSGEVVKLVSLFLGTYLGVLLASHLGKRIEKEVLRNN